MNRSRRWLAAPAVALSFALLGAACSGGSSGNGGEDAAADLPPCPVEALSTATGTTDIVVWYQLNGKAAQTLEAMVEEYNASQSKVKVRAELQGASYEELLRKYEQAIPTNALPNIIVAEDTATQFLIDSGTVLQAQKCFDADGLDTDGFVPAAVNHFTSKGGIWPGTASVSDLLTYYNKNHFRRAGLDPNVAPQTLADVRTMAETIKAAGITDTPVVLRMDSWFPETQLTGSRQPLVDNDNGFGDGTTTEALFDTETTTQLFEWVQSMVADGLLLPTQATDGNVDHYLAMASQRGSITMETSTAATTIESFLGGDTSVSTGISDSAAIDTSALDIGAAPVFGVDAAGKAQIGGNGFFITTTGTDAQKAAAWDLIKWWNQEPQQVQWHVEGSYLPFLSSVASSPEVQTFWSTTLSGSFLKVAYEEFTTGVDPNFTGALIGPYDKFRVAMRNALAQVAFQGGDPATAIATAKDETDEAITQYNDTNF